MLVRIKEYTLNMYIKGLIHELQALCYAEKLACQYSLTQED